MRLLFDADAMTAAGLDTQIHVLSSGSVLVDIQGTGPPYAKMMEGIINTDKLIILAEESGFSKHESALVCDELIDFICNKMMQKYIFVCALLECKKHDQRSKPKKN